MKVIIIEDEPLMAEALREELEASNKSVEVTCILGSIKASIDYLKKHASPDLFFSDIQLSDGLSFEIFKQVQSSAPVIFCTAFDEYALSAFQANGIDYVLKPFTSKDIQAALRKYESLTQRPNENRLMLDGLEELVKQYATPPAIASLLVQRADKIIPVKIENIALILLENGTCKAYTFDGTTYNVSSSMDKLMGQLGDLFFRLNRTAIIRHNAVEQASQWFSRKLLIQSSVKVNEKLVVSKANASSFLRWLEQH